MALSFCKMIISNQMSHIETVMISSKSTSHISGSHPTQSNHGHNHGHTHSHTHVHIHSMSFNQDKNCISLGTSDGIYVRTLSLDPTKRMNHYNQLIDHTISGGAVMICEMLHSTSLLAIVTQASPRTLSLLNTKHQMTNKHLKQNTTETKTKSKSKSKSDAPTFLCNVHFAAAIRKVELTRSRMFVLTADAKLHILNMRHLKIIQSIPILHATEPIRNLMKDQATQSGVYFDVSKHSNQNQNQMFMFLVCKSSQEVGAINVYDTQDDKLIRLISKTKAHDSSIARIAIGGKGKHQRLATASVKVSTIYNHFKNIQ